MLRCNESPPVTIGAGRFLKCVIYLRTCVRHPETGCDAPGVPRSTFYEPPAARSRIPARRGESVARCGHLFGPLVGTTPLM
jgi:hypothetical protein